MEKPAVQLVVFVVEPEHVRFTGRQKGPIASSSGVDAVSLARMIIGLGESLGLAMVAEGIEHQVQRERLLAMGCEFGQGYLFAKPLADAAIRALLTAGRPLCPAPDTTTRTRTGSMDLIAPV